MTYGWCMACGRRLDRTLVDISTLSDRVPRWLPGQWEVCCGWLVATPCRSFRSYDVPVPTPEDLLRGASLTVGWP